MKLFYNISLLLIFTCSSCQEEISSSQVIYSNNFEQLSELPVPRSLMMGGNRVLGNFHNDGFTVELSNLPDHKFLQITCDVIIHDTWDGNMPSPNGPDLWNIRVNRKQNINTNSDFFYQTSFSNFSSRRRPQSFPNRYPSFNDPKSANQGGAYGICADSLNASGSTFYRIDEILRHEEDVAFIRFFDELVQTNTEDPFCDESWSLDNLIITIWN